MNKEKLFPALRHVKNSGGCDGIRTHDLCDAGATLYQLNYMKPFSREQVSLLQLGSFVSAVKDSMSEMK